MAAKTQKTATITPMTALGVWRTERTTDPSLEFRAAGAAPVKDSPGTATSVSTPGRSTRSDAGLRLMAAAPSRSVPDLRVEIGVQQVGNQVASHVDHRNDHDARFQQRHVVVQAGIEQQAAKTG